MEEANWLVLLPVIVITAMLIRRPIESLLAGVFTGLLMLEPGAAITNFSWIQLKVVVAT